MHGMTTSFMNFCELRQSLEMFTYNSRLVRKKAFSYLFPNKFLYVYLPETYVCALKRVGQKIPRFVHLCILNLWCGKLIARFTNANEQRYSLNYVFAYHFNCVLTIAHLLYVLQ